MPNEMDFNTRASMQVKHVSKALVFKSIGMETEIYIAARRKGKEK